jgi:hypothetical protein
MAQIADDFRIGNREGEDGTVVSLRFSLAGSESGRVCGGPVGGAG